MIDGNPVKPEKFCNKFGEKPFQKTTSWKIWVVFQLKKVYDKKWFPTEALKTAEKNSVFHNFNIANSRSFGQKRMMTIASDGKQELLFSWTRTAWEEKP